MGKRAHGSPVNPLHSPCRHAPEWWPGMRRNTGPAWTGIVARHGPEYAARLGTAGLHGHSGMRSPCCYTWSSRPGLVQRLSDPTSSSIGPPCNARSESLPEASASIPCVRRRPPCSRAIRAESQHKASHHESHAQVEVRDRPTSQPESNNGDTHNVLSMSRRNPANNGDTHKLLSMSGRNPGHVARSRRPASYCESREELAERSVVRPILAAQPMLPAALGRAGSDRAAIEVVTG
jgi:hypothetical protein